MRNKKITLSIIKEARIDENRTPLVPSQISNLLVKLSNLKIIVQPSKNRCFKDEDYLKAGAEITDDLSNADIILGVKEVEISKLIKNKTYFKGRLGVKDDADEKKESFKNFVRKFKFYASGSNSRQCLR